MIINYFAADKRTKRDEAKHERMWGNQQYSAEGFGSVEMKCGQQIKPWRTFILWEPLIAAISVFFLVAPTVPPPRGSWLVDSLQSVSPPWVSRRPIPPWGWRDIGYLQEEPPGATMSYPWPCLGETSMDACNPAPLVCLFGLTKDPARGDIDVVGWQQGHLASPCIGPRSEMEVDTLAECSVGNWCSWSGKKKLLQFAHWFFKSN